MPYKNKEDFNSWDKIRKARNQVEVNKLKSKPCIDCGGVFPPWVMEFDHVPERGEKVANVSCLSRSRSINAPTFLKEASKCDIVCANCHKNRTYLRRIS